MIERDFAGWFDREALVLWDVRHEFGHISRVYKNVRTGFGFAHEFTNDRPFAQCYDEVRRKYDRRIARFLERLRTAHRVLAVFICDPRQGRPADAVLVEARDRLAAKFPAARFDLVCAYEDPACATPAESCEADGIAAVGMHYRTMLNGEIMHVCDYGVLRDYIAARVSIAGSQSDEEWRRFEAGQKREFMAKLGRTWFERRLNRKLCDLYHDVAAYLIGQGLVPGDRPLWFDGTGK